MPLLDHFHPPLSEQRHWESFHGHWAAALSDALNAGLLPAGYFAEMQVTLAGGRVEVDVPTLGPGSNGSPPASTPDVREGGVAALTPSVSLRPHPASSCPLSSPTRSRALVFGTEGGPTLVGVSNW